MKEIFKTAVEKIVKILLLVFLIYGIFVIFVIPLFIKTSPFFIFKS